MFSNSLSHSPHSPVRRAVPSRGPTRRSLLLLRVVVLARRRLGGASVRVSILHGQGPELSMPQRGRRSTRPQRAPLRAAIPGAVVPGAPAPGVGAAVTRTSAAVSKAARASFEAEPLVRLQSGHGRAVPLRHFSCQKL